MPPDAKTTLPPDPAATHCIGMFGVVVWVPLDWNLHLYRGDAAQGFMALADLHGIRMEIRWRALTPRRRWRLPFAHVFTPSPPFASAIAPDLLAAPADRPPPARPSPPYPPPAEQPTMDPTGAYLSSDPRREYEFFWDMPEPDAPTPTESPPLPSAADLALRRSIAASFRATIPDMTDGPTWYWSIYGAMGWVPSAARLARASLLPGKTTLDFTIPAKSGYVAGARQEAGQSAVKAFTDRAKVPARLRCFAVTLGSFSRAAALLGTMPIGDPPAALRAWAETSLPFLKTLQHPRWTVGDRGWLVEGLTRERRLRRPILHRLTYAHDHAANRIHWTHEKFRAPRFTRLQLET